MVRIIEHREHARTGEELFELRVFRLDYGEVRACVIRRPSDQPQHDRRLSEPMAQAFLGGLALCEREDIPNL
jgi:hypothetical protein